MWIFHWLLSLMENEILCICFWHALCFHVKLIWLIFWLYFTSVAMSSFSVQNASENYLCTARQFTNLPKSFKKGTLNRNAPYIKPPETVFSIKMTRLEERWSDNISLISIFLSYCANSQFMRYWYLFGATPPRTRCTLVHGDQAHSSWQQQSEGGGLL